MFTFYKDGDSSYSHTRLDNSFFVLSLFFCRGKALFLQLPSLCYKPYNFQVPEAVSKAIATTDVYGPPDPKSSLRLITFYIPPDETEAEKEYRLRRAQVQEWNHLFWTIHNVQFTQVINCLIKFEFTFDNAASMSRPKKNL